MARKLALSLVIGLIYTGIAVAHDGDPDFRSAFERLKSLAGAWQIEGEDNEVTYSLTGGGSAIVELFSGMASVYHMDGNDLRVTHFCGAKNQPRMKATGYDPEKGILKFDFVDVTNLKAPDAYFTREIEISFTDEDHVEIRFDGLEEGVARPSTVMLRKK